MLKPLNEQLNKEKKWQWTSACESAFQKAEALLVSQDVLTHYNPELPLRLACDASPYWVGAVLSHVMPNGEEKSIACASQTLCYAWWPHFDSLIELQNLATHVSVYKKTLGKHRYTLGCCHPVLRKGYMWT